MNEKILSLLLLFCVSETFFIVLISFVCGYCVGYYFYDIIMPRKKSEEEIIQFFLSYNEKHGFPNRSFSKNESE